MPPLMGACPPTGNPGSATALLFSKVHQNIVYMWHHTAPPGASSGPNEA